MLERKSTCRWINESGPARAHPPVPSRHQPAAVCLQPSTPRARRWSRRARSSCSCTSTPSRPPTSRDADLTAQRPTHIANLKRSKASTPRPTYQRAPPAAGSFDPPRGGGVLVRHLRTRPRTTASQPRPLRARRDMWAALRRLAANHAPLPPLRACPYTPRRRVPAPPEVRTPCPPAFIPFPPSRCARDVDRRRWRGHRHRRLPVAGSGTAGRPCSTEPS